MKLIASSKLFNLRFSPKNFPPPVANRYIGSRTHPIRPKILHMYENRDPRSLWWYLSNQRTMPYTKVVRSWCMRRTREAFRQALRERGFNADGRRIATDPRGTGTPVDGYDYLQGSVELSISPEIVRESYATVKAEMDSIVDGMLQNWHTEWTKAMVKSQSIRGHS
ncbi:hypothetical protein EYZ11_012655 [Aspergillus tanneri]|uniref:Uncharacterized protein n=1 Tax=Aspergillus tanneri TaxID=1220188 RepID=A0A4S3J1T7_9EURO|nr:uncharacterized protein ATNIH1004_010198 [Aspergillus tanneri]KAA8643429.1 hypothetical protein ATNIH1004_010198 [Aspergillus tanneri]THC87897.1 hypothetical protein EYZ11_012655 [Aspergillus tanneri]